MSEELAKRIEKMGQPWYGLAMGMIEQVPDNLTLDPESVVDLVILIISDITEGNPRYGMDLCRRMNKDREQGLKTVLDPKEAAYVGVALGIAHRMQGRMAHAAVETLGN